MIGSPRVLIFGGNGGIGRRMAESMLTNSWHVTSVIRDPGQESAILQLGPRQGPKADVLVVDLAHMKDADANKIITQVKPNYIVFAAGSMGNVNAVDRDAAKKVIKASVGSLDVTKFLMISFPASRRKRAPWWDNTDHKNFLAEVGAYPEVAKAKLDADEYLVALTKRRNDDRPHSFQAISLRPSWLTNAPRGKIHLGQTKFSGRVSRADVAAVAVSLLSRDDTSGWFDLVDGSHDIKTAVDMVVRDNINSIDGEDVEQMYSQAA